MLSTSKTYLFDVHVYILILANTGMLSMEMLLLSIPQTSEPNLVLSTCWMFQLTEKLLSSSNLLEPKILPQPRKVFQLNCKNAIINYCHSYVEFGSTFDQVFADRIDEANGFYQSVIPANLNKEEKAVARQAYAGKYKANDIHSDDFL